MTGEMSWFFNMCVNSGCTEEVAGIATAVVAVIITYSLLKIFTFALFPKR